MVASRVEKVIEQIRGFSAAERLELLRSLMNEGILAADDRFTEEEIAEIEAARREVAQGEWVDFDVFRKEHGL